MSMAAKSSNITEEMSGASLQADGQMEEPAQGTKDLRESEEDDSSPSCSPLWSPAWRPLSGCPNMKYLFTDRSNFGQRTGVHTLTFSLLDGPISGRYVARSKDWTY